MRKVQDGKYVLLLEEKEIIKQIAKIDTGNPLASFPDKLRFVIRKGLKK